MAEDTPGWQSDFERGVSLFNAGRFFDCHEVWEIAWTRASGHEKVLIQALIQAAVALLHLERGNLRGAQSVWEKARTKFKAQPANLMDLDLKEFCAALERVFIAAHEGRPTGAVPRLRLHETGAR